MYAQQTEEVFVLLLEIANEVDPTQPIRVALDSSNLDSTLEKDGDATYSSAKTFAGGFFRIELPEEAGENISTVRMSIDNVDQKIVTAIRSASEPPAVKMWVVLKSTPDTIEAGPYHLVLEGATYDQYTVTGELSFEDITNRRWPKHSFTPFYSPGLF
tara:strand:+ start:113 stop:586 length:474 start_codon:yes stop_codon:yes gene_type:complete